MLTKKVFLELRIEKYVESKHGFVLKLILNAIMKMRCCLIQLCHKLILNSSYLQPGLVGGGLSLSIHILNNFGEQNKQLKLIKLLFIEIIVIVYFR